jgi:hypothetical protein
LKPGIHYFLIPEGAAAAEQIMQHRPRFIIIMPDWTSPKGGQYPKRFPEEAYQGLVNGSLGYRLAARFKSESLVTRQILDYPTVNPPIEIYVKR